MLQYYTIHKDDEDQYDLGFKFDQRIAVRGEVFQIFSDANGTGRVLEIRSTGIW